MIYIAIKLKSILEVDEAISRGEQKNSKEGGKENNSYIEGISKGGPFFFITSLEEIC